MDGSIAITSSLLATTITHPIDIIKTRVQVSRLSNNPINIPTALKSIYKYNGIKSFYKGLLPNLGTYPVFWSVYFQTNSYNFEPTSYKYFNIFLKAQGAAGIASTLSNPLYLFKTRAQTNNNNISYRELIKKIFKKEGILGFYKGLLPTFINNSKLGIQMPIYDYFRDIKEFNSINASLIAKSFSTTLYYPLDLIRVNQRNSITYISMKDIIKTVYKNGGFFGLYRGVFLYNMISTPNFVLMMYFRDKLRIYFI